VDFHSPGTKHQASHETCLALLIHHTAEDILSNSMTTIVNGFISSSTSFWYQFLHFRLTYIPSPITSSSSDSPLCTSITHSLFHARLKTYLFYKSYPPCSFTSSSRTAFMDYRLDYFFWATWFLFLVFPYFSFLCRALN